MVPAVVRALTSSVISGLSLLLVLVFALRVFLQALQFSSPTKINISKFQFDLEFDGHAGLSVVDCCVLPSLNIVDLFILLTWKLGSVHAGQNTAPFKLT